MTRIWARSRVEAGVEPEGVEVACGAEVGEEGAFGERHGERADGDEHENVIWKLASVRARGS